MEGVRVKPGTHLPRVSLLLLSLLFVADIFMNLRGFETLKKIGRSGTLLDDRLERAIVLRAGTAAVMMFVLLARRSIFPLAAGIYLGIKAMSSVVVVFQALGAAESWRMFLRNLLLNVWDPFSFVFVFLLAFEPWKLRYELGSRGIVFYKTDP